MPDHDAGSAQWIILRFDKLEYALHVEVIVEVIRMVAIRPLPDTQPWIAGLLNMRGRGIPVMDLRVRLGMNAKPYTLDMVIVVIEVDGQPLGLIVDQAVEFLALSPDSIRPPDRISVQSDVVSGVAHAGERLIMILNARNLVAVRLPELPAAAPLLGSE